MEKCCDKCVGLNPEMWGKLGLTGCPCDCHQKAGEEYWEKEFWKLFLTPEGFWNKENDFYAHKVINFIANQIKLAEERGKKEAILGGYEWVTKVAKAEGFRAGVVKGFEWYNTETFEKRLKEAKAEGFKEAVEEAINLLETNPNPDGSISPSIQHWIEAKQREFKQSLLEKGSK